MIEQLSTYHVSESSVLSFPSSGISILELFTYWLNLMEPPSRYFMEVLSHFVDDELHRDKLREFCSNTVDGKSEYFRYSIREKRTVLEVLSDFFSPGTTFKLPLPYLIQLCGRQKPREFSISSAQRVSPDEVHLTMAVTEY